MERKKQGRTKEVSAPITEASSSLSAIDQANQQQPPAPRRRGRPRKITNKVENKQESAEEGEDESTENRSKKAKTTKLQRQEHEEEEEEKGKILGSSKIELDGESGEKLVEEPTPLPRRRTRRKSKPVKSW